MTASAPSVRYRKTFQPDQLIMTQGERGMEAYVIETGQVEIFVENEGRRVTLAKLGPGEIFGEMALIDRGPRSASARATMQTTCTLMSDVVVEQLLERAPNGIKALLHVMIQRVRDTTTQLAEHRAQIRMLAERLAQREAQLSQRQAGQVAAPRGRGP